MVKSNNQPICEIDEYGTKRWYLNGQLHREDAPAIAWFDGHKEWFIYGRRHREDGPAIEFTDGAKVWYFHDQYHRIDGPAIEYNNGEKRWLYHGKLIDCDSQEKFERLIKLKFLF